MSLTSDQMMEIRKAATENIALLQRLSVGNIRTTATIVARQHPRLWQWCRSWHHLQTAQPMPSKLQKAQGKTLDQFLADAAQGAMARK